MLLVAVTCSLIIPVYRNEESIDDLLAAITAMNERLERELEAVLVVDGSPDQSFQCLAERLPQCRFPSRLITHSRNFGSFAAIRTGLAEASGQHFAVMAADLQEPPDLIDQFFAALKTGECDVVIGTRDAREDPMLSQLPARVFWWLYRKFVQPSMPAGGVDVFGCGRSFRDHLLALEESNSSLVGLIFWLGFRRKEIPYRRQKRQHGKSGWTLRKKVRYLSDSLYSFSDFPVRLLVACGFAGLVLALGLGLVVLVARASGLIEVPGYTATVLIVLLFAGLNSLGLGIIGSYAWRAFENTKGRPLAVVLSRTEYRGL